MVYSFPPSLFPLRDYLRHQGADTRAFVSARQAAFMAQQLLGTRVKFPNKGADMTATLFLIQKAVTEQGLKPAPDSFEKQPKEKGKKRKEKSPYANMKKAYHDFSLERFSKGLHVFCDGAAVPNPGTGGWGYVAYHNGIEVDAFCGGDPSATNNQMELVGLLNAIEKAKSLARKYRAQAVVWSDSRYCVEGVNVWMKTWKARGWSKRKLNSPKRDEGGIKNLDLWKAIDASLSEDSEADEISVQWVKGHNGIAGNERADELAEQGRQRIVDEGGTLPVDTGEN